MHELPASECSFLVSCTSERRVLLKCTHLESFVAALDALEDRRNETCFCKQIPNKEQDIHDREMIINLFSFAVVLIILLV